VIIVCGGAVAYRRLVRVCPVCGERRRIVAAYDASPYYAPSFTCCGCGDSWSDGELRPRPFARGWREEAKKKARRQWQEATSGPIQRDAEGYVVA
jgi:hypothetical protein